MTQDLFSLEGRPALTTRAAKRIGSIVKVASVLSFHGGVLVPAYTASKHALARFTKALVDEWAPAAVTLKAVPPGIIETKNTGAIRERTLAGGWGIPSDVVPAVAFLPRPAAHNLEGHVLVPEGGWIGR